MALKIGFWGKKPIEPLVLAFDNGGMLVDSESSYYLANKQTFQKYSSDLVQHGFDPTSYNLSDFLNHNVETDKGTNGYLLEKNIPAPLVKTIKTARNEIFDIITETKKESGTWIIENRIQQLQALKKEFGDAIKLVLVTTSSNKRINKMHAQVVPAGLFEAKITKDDLSDPKKIKPYPDLYQLINQKLGHTGKYLAFEDTARGVEAVLSAQNNGVPYIIHNDITKQSVIETPGAPQIKFEDIRDLVLNELQTKHIRFRLKKVVDTFKKFLKRVLNL